MIVLKNRIKSYELFDGVKKHQVKMVYDNWLSSMEYEDYSKSHVKENNIIIPLFTKSTKKLNVGEQQINKEVLKKIAKEFDFIIEEKNDEVLFYKSKNKYDKYYLTTKNCDEDNYIIIFSLGGGRAVESITVYGTWKIELSKELKKYLNV